MPVLLWLFLVLNLIMSYAQGYDGVPEFKSVWDDQPIERLLQWQDSEYRADHHIFQYPSEFDRKWIAGSNIYQVTVGSLGSKEFLVKQRLRVVSQFTSKVDFRLFWFEDRDWEEDSRHFAWEFGFKPANWRYSVFGNAQLYKQENDAGVALEYSPSDSVLDRLSVSFTDFDRNQRSQGNSTWDKEPVVVTLNGHRGGDSYFLYYLRWEPNSQLDDVEYDYDYHRSKVSLGFRGELSSWNDRRYEYKFHLEEKSEDNNAHSGSGHVSSSYDIRKIMLDFGRVQDYGLHTLNWGLSGYFVEVQAGQESSVISDILPYVWYGFPPQKRTEWSSQWQVGFDLNIHQVQDDAAIIKRDNDEVESRASLKYQMLFPQKGSIDLLFTFDVDQFGSSETWEGGAASLNLEF